MFKGILLAAVVLATGQAWATPDQGADAQLHDRLSAIQQSTPKEVRSLPLGTQVRVMQLFAKKADPVTKKCVDSKRVTFAKKYVMSFDAQNQPCRVYDLSFPTVKTAFGGKSVLELPVQNFTARDYLNWLDGKFEAVYDRTEKFRSTPNEVIARNSWIAQVKFRPNAKITMNKAGLPLSFHASDIELGRKLQFTKPQQDALRSLITQVKANAPAGQEPETAYWNAMVSNPEKALEGIRFDWNELRKVYEIFLEGEFLPLGGPVALVDYKVQYKFAAERMIRSIMVSALRGVVGFVPAGIVRNVIDIAITDSFQFVEMMYDYQMNQLEDVMRTAVRNGQGFAGIEAVHINKGMNVLFGERSDLITEYMMAVAQGRTFDFEALDKIGRMARYNVEKQREVKMTQNFSKLSLEEKCSMKVINGYFGICAKNNKRESVYSLISDYTILMWNLGAPVVHYYDMPMGVPLMRGTAWLLSMGARIFDFPLNITLSDTLKDFAQWGMMDEAFMKSQMDQQRANGTLAADDAVLHKWLYIQNLNLFLPKTPESEDAVINANASLFN